MMRYRPLLLAGSLAMLAGLPGGGVRAAGHHRHAAREVGAPVLLSRQPGTAQDRAARMLNAHDMQGAARRGETPLVLVGSARLAAQDPGAAPRGDEALFVQLQSASLCGSAGCSTSVYLRHDHRWRKVLDSVSGPIRVMKEQHEGAHDLLVGKNDRWIWDGQVYQDSLQAPPLANLKRSVEQHRAAMRRHPDRS